MPTLVLLSRRQLLLPSVSGLWDALTGGSNSACEAVLAVRHGMLLFRQVFQFLSCFPYAMSILVYFGEFYLLFSVAINNCLLICLLKGDVLGSLVEFDKAIELDPRQKACEFLNFSSTIMCNNNGINVFRLELKKWCLTTSFSNTLIFTSITFTF